MIKYLRISEMMRGCYILCLLVFLLVVQFYIWPLFCNHLDKEESWLLHFNYIVDICVPCPFLKVQWVSQVSLIMTFPSHVHL